MLRVLVDAEHHSQYKFLEIIHHFRALYISTKKAPRISRGFFIFNQTSYALYALCFFAFGSEPNGLFLAKSTNTGAATKIEE